MSIMHKASRFMALHAHSNCICHSWRLCVTLVPLCFPHGWVRCAARGGGYYVQQKSSQIMTVCCKGKAAITAQSACKQGTQNQFERECKSVDTGNAKLPAASQHSRIPLTTQHVHVRHSAMLEAGWYHSTHTSTASHDVQTRHCSHHSHPCRPRYIYQLVAPQQAYSPTQPFCLQLHPATAAALIMKRRVNTAQN